MSTLTGILNIGTTGMMSGQFGVEVASQNAANAATEGFTRRVAEISPLGPRPLAGVRATGAGRVTDPYIERRMLGARSMSGEAAAKTLTFSVLDRVFAEGPGSLGESMDRFRAALADFARDPHEPATRTVMLAEADALASTFNRIADELGTARADTNDRIVDSVGEVNDALEEIAELGKEISRYEVSGQEASDLRDRRDLLVQKVAELVPVKVIPEENGTISLLLGGSVSLVGPDGTVNALQTVEDPGTGDVTIHRTTAGALTDITKLVSGGKIGGYIAARDGALRDASDRLDQLAFDFASAYNATHQAGVGLDGGTGRNLFDVTPTADGAASAIRVSADVAGRPDLLAAATDPTALPGDNRNALALLELSERDLAASGTRTFGEEYGAIVAAAGSATRAALADEEQADSIMAQLSALRDSISGVSTDEEMVSLMRFQRAYQASLKVIQTADEMLAELMTLKR